MKAFHLIRLASPCHEISTTANHGSGGLVNLIQEIGELRWRAAMENSASAHHRRHHHPPEIATKAGLAYPYLL